MSKIDKKKFVEYHLANPEIWKEFEALALKLIEGGVNHYGAKCIMEVIRYHRTVNTKGKFKIDNDFTALYARQFARKYPQHKDFFEFRGEKQHAA